MNATDAFLSPLVTTPNANPALVHLSNVHLSFGANEVLKGAEGRRYPAAVPQALANPPSCVALQVFYGPNRVKFEWATLGSTR